MLSSSGRGVPPPLPPQMIAKGGGKGTRTMPPTPSFAKGKGKGGTSRPRVQFPPPPPELRAPVGVTLRRVKPLVSSTGTFWEGLNLWNAESSHVLEGTTVDFGLLASLWEPMPQAPASMDGNRNTIERSILPASVSQRAEIVVKASKISPESVRAALTDDVTALTPTQAIVLETELLPLISEATPYLEVVFGRHGLSRFNETELVFWTVISTPEGTLRARFVAERYRANEELLVAQARAERAEVFVQFLRESKPFRSVLQVILVIRNILTQTGAPGHPCSMFPKLQSERPIRPHPSPTFDPVTRAPIPIDLNWIRENSPSVLRLAAEMLETTHVYRCRLRFLRMMAVGRMLELDQTKRVVWSFLDDLLDSPHDALAQLNHCSSVYNRDLFLDMRLRYERLRRCEQDLVAFLGRGALSDNLFNQQMKDLNEQVAEAVSGCAFARERLTSAAVDICQLAGVNCEVQSPALPETAGEVLNHLSALGRDLEGEVLFIRSSRERALEELRGGAFEISELRKRPSRRWPLVETNTFGLMSTQDVDLIRRFRTRNHLRHQRARSHASGGGQTQQSSGSEEDEPLPRGPAHYVDLVHGGLAGQYKRDPLTGSWGRRLDNIDGTCSVDMRLGGPRVDP
eukprot:TRINITY_DN2297_c0_g1_i3.p1 TRINITY_DN2297_c0_g1~~TRINITY_DN2297_c0_g1_i3.p1  ORF type:complete len:651 (-),score=55.05 TRINITY_DN2297_c0_g1_i3:111-1997(-)